MENGFRFRYLYDFGDGWEHILQVEKIAPADAGTSYPTCLKGKRACPPEDVGGAWGYQSFLQAIGDPDHPEHAGYLDWIDGTFDPEAFDLEAVNAGLRRLKRSAGAESAWPTEEDLAEENRAAPAAAWAQELPEAQQAQAENLPLRRDLVALLTYLRENRVTGTQATGNFPLKAVRDISALFVDPPKLEHTIGDQVSRVRSEMEVWSLYFRHGLAAVGGWAAGGPARRWRLTPSGDHFLTLPAPLQVWLMLDVWWTQVNWAIASPVGFEEEELTARFRDLTLSHLLDLPSGKSVSFATFADRLSADAGLAWPTENQDLARRILRAVVERVVINPLVDFELLETGYQPHPLYGARIRDLATIQVTPFGKSLLQSLRR